MTAVPDVNSRGQLASSHVGTDIMKTELILLYMTIELIQLYMTIESIRLYGECREVFGLSENVIWEQLQTKQQQMAGRNGGKR